MPDPTRPDGYEPRNLDDSRNRSGGPAWWTGVGLAAILALGVLIFASYDNSPDQRADQSFKPKAPGVSTTMDDSSTGASTGEAGSSPSAPAAAPEAQQSPPAAAPTPEAPAPKAPEPTTPPAATP